MICFLVPPSMFLHWRVSMYLMSAHLIRLETLKPHLVPCRPHPLLPEGLGRWKLLENLPRCTVRKGKGKDILLTTSFRLLLYKKNSLRAFWGEYLELWCFEVPKSMGIWVSEKNIHLYLWCLKWHPPKKGAGSWLLHVLLGVLSSWTGLKHQFTIVSLGIPSHPPKYHFDNLTMYVDLPKSLWKDLVRCEFWMSKTLPLEGWSKEAPDFGKFWRCLQITNLQNHRTFLGKETILERNFGVPFWDKANLLDVFLFKFSI